MTSVPDIGEGSIVENPLKPEWGPGKVARLRGDKADVFFRDLAGERARTFKLDALRLAASQSDPILDNLPPFTERKGELVLGTARITVAEARERFLRHYPGGFSDPGFLGHESGGERIYKWAAHERFLSAFGHGRGRELVASGDVDFVAEVTHVLGRANNLPAVQEYLALREGLSNPDAARRYLSTLLDLIDAGPERDAFVAHAEATASLPAVGSTHTDKWTLCTILPYLARPDAFMFVKPTLTKAAAAALGFDIRYDSHPNWSTYSRILEMSRLYMELLADLGPRDFIDIQSFFWVTGEAFERTLARHRAR